MRSGYIWHTFDMANQIDIMPFAETERRVKSFWKASDGRRGPNIGNIGDCYWPWGTPYPEGGI